MYAVGVCWRRGGWVFGVYRRQGDVYVTLRVRRIKRGVAAGLKVHESACIQAGWRRG